MSAEFSKFRPIIERLPRGTNRHPDLLLAESRKHRLYYTPFEHVNRGAELVIVGISPGPKQLRLAVEEVQRCKGLADAEVLARAKRHGSFGGSTVKPPLLRMLDHFQVAQRLGLACAQELWTSGWPKFQATSVVPHAAFSVKQSGELKCFNGSFREVLGDEVLRTCFEQHFVPQMAFASPHATWIGLGPTAAAALNWCVAKGLLQPKQVVSFPHPSTNAGSQEGYFLRQRARESFNPRDPVRHRCEWMDAAYAGAAAVFGARA